MALAGALLGLLLAEPAHGYQLQATLEAELGPLWETRASQVYLTLGRLERDGLVVVTRQRQEKRPDRQLLQLTARGRAAALQWLEDVEGGEDLVVRLAVARMAAPDRFEEVARATLEARQAALRRLRSLRRELTEGFQAEALEAEVKRVEGEVRWAGGVLDNADHIVARAPAGRRPRRSLPEAHLA
jgi:DNA-binding PadR family transcriptional regulator